MGFSSMAALILLAGEEGQGDQPELEGGRAEDPAGPAGRVLASLSLRDFVEHASLAGFDAGIGLSSLTPESAGRSGLSSRIEKRCQPRRGSRPGRLLPVGSASPPSAARGSGGPAPRSRPKCRLPPRRLARIPRPRHEKNCAQNSRAPGEVPRDGAIRQGHEFPGGFGIRQNIRLMAAGRSAWSESSQQPMCS